MKRGILLFGPSFSGLGDTYEILREELEKEGVSIGPQSGEMDIEERMKRATGSPSMFDLLLYRPREDVRSLWRDSLKGILKDIEEQNLDTFIITGHSVYFNETYNSFFSPVDVTLLSSLLNEKEIEVVSIITIFDDVFDMIVRHGNQERAPKNQRQLYRDQLKIESASLRVRGGLKEEEVWALARSNVLLKLSSFFLIWRRLELLTSEMISSSLKARFIPFALKNPFPILKKIIKTALEGNPIPLAYLSHSISHFRRHWERGEGLSGEESNIVRAINAIPLSLLQHEIAVISPSSIDELRFKKENDWFTGELTRRWDLLEDTLYERIEKRRAKKRGASFDSVSIKERADNKKLLYPSIPSNPNDPASLLEGTPLERISPEMEKLLQERILPVREEIYFQVGERDHLLVSHVDLMIAMHPLSKKGEIMTISGGVYKEIEHWHARVRREEQKEERRSAFIYIKGSMLSEFVTKEICENGLYALKDVVEQYLKERNVPKPDFSSKYVLGGVWGIGEAPTASPLGYPISPYILDEIRAERKSIEREAVRSIVENTLTLATPNSSMFIFKDITDLFCRLGEVSNFLREGSKPAVDYSSSISPDLSGDACDIIRKFSIFYPQMK